MRGKRFYQALGFRMTCSLVLALFLLAIPFFFFFYRLHERQLIASVSKPMSDLSQLILFSLERRMLANQPHLLDPDIRQLAKEAGGARIVILDKEGQVKVSSDPTLVGRTLSRREAECSTCHDRREVPDRVSLSRPTEGELARDLLVIRNRESCYPCHPSTQKINGTLVVDFPMTQATARLRSDMSEMLILALGMVVVTVLALVTLVDRLVVRRIRALERTTVAIRNGFLDERAPAAGHDEVSELASSFNSMACGLKESLKEIERHKDYLEKVLNSIEDEIVVVDRQFRVVAANQAFLKTTIRSKEELIGRRCCRDRAENDPVCRFEASSQCPARATFQTRAVEKTVRCVQANGGSEKYIEIYSYPLLNEDAEVFQVIEVRRDITERRRLEANLGHSERLALIGLLASGISHEINNPLASIVTCSEGLEKRLRNSHNGGSPDKEEMLEYLNLISREGMRVKAITQRLLILARKSDSANHLISVNASLAETILLVKFQADTREIAIAENYDETLPELRCDDPALRQVFLNLLLNAVQNTEPGGRITATVRRREQAVEIIVADTGRGIAVSDLERVFEPFYSNRIGDRGTGLGLFISNTLVRQMGGQISVVSQPGQGASFTVRLPFSDRSTTVSPGRNA